MSNETPIENGLGFKTDKEDRKLFAVYAPTPDKLDLTANLFKERLAASPFADLFVNEYLIAEFLRRYKSASENESFECEIGERRDSHCEIYISEDKLKAHLSITPNFGGKEVTLVDVQHLLTEKRIVWGIAPTEDIEVVIEKGRCADFIIAQGLEPVAGVDAKFLSLMPEVQERKPHVDENGNIDYRELGDIVIVRKGEVLMQRIPPIPGKKGRNIFGDIIEPTGGADIPFSGDKKGVHINPEDSNQLLSSITGQPVQIPNGIIVSPVLTLKQVNFASGNIRFDGSVAVQGDVKEGMKVYALEDITIEGSVTDAQIECMGTLHIKGGVTGNSELIANGDIKIDGGVQGSQEIHEPVGDDTLVVAKIVSHSSVILGFVENFNVEAGVDIVVEKYAMNSQLMAGNKIVAGAKNSAKKSSLMGGITWAMMLVKATLIGASSGIKTHVQVGTNPYIQKRIQVIRKILTPNEKEQKDIHKILAFIDSHPEKGNQEILEKLHHTLSKLIIEADMYQAELKELVSNMTTIEDAKVIAERGVYTGSEIQINNVLWKAQENRGKSVFRVEKREMTINSR